MKKIGLLALFISLSSSLFAFDFLKQFSFDVPLGSSYDNQAAIIFNRENPTGNSPSTTVNTVHTFPFGFLGGVGVGADINLFGLGLGLSVHYLEEIHFYPPDSEDFTEEGAVDYYPYDYTYWTRTHVQQLHFDARFSFFLDKNYFFGIGGMYSLEFVGVHLGRDPDSLSVTPHQSLFEPILPPENPQVYFTAHFGYIPDKPALWGWKLGWEVNLDAPIPFAFFFPDLTPFYINYRFNIGGTVKLIYTFK